MDTARGEPLDTIRMYGRDWSVGLGEHPVKGYRLPEGKVAVWREDSDGEQKRLNTLAIDAGDFEALAAGEHISRDMGRYKVALRGLLADVSDYWVSLLGVEQRIELVFNDDPFDLFDFSSFSVVHDPSDIRWTLNVDTNESGALSMCAQLGATEMGPNYNYLYSSSMPLGIDAVKLCALVEIGGIFSEATGHNRNDLVEKSIAIHNLLFRVWKGFPYGETIHPGILRAIAAGSRKRKSIYARRKPLSFRTRRR